MLYNFTVCTKYELSATDELSERNSAWAEQFLHNFSPNTLQLTQQLQHFHENGPRTEFSLIVSFKVLKM